MGAATDVWRRDCREGAGAWLGGPGQAEGKKRTASIRLQMLSAKFKVPLSPTNECGQLNIGLTKNTTALVRHSRSPATHSLRTIRYIKLYLASLVR